MPVPEVPRLQPVLGHVNLMVDTLIANAGVDDLRAIVRTMLATSPPAVAASFTAAARSRLGQMKLRAQPATLFVSSTDCNNMQEPVPTSELTSLLTFARSLYGARMGFDSLEIFAAIVRVTSGLRWADEGRMADALALVDLDISQAIQSCKEELAAGLTTSLGSARSSLRNVTTALADCQSEVESWGGEFPFERGSINAEYLELSMKSDPVAS